MAATATLDEIKAKIETLAQRNPAYAELCGFYGELLLQTMQEDPQDDGGKLKLDAEAAARGLSQGRSLLDLSQVELDWDQAGRRLQGLAAIVDKRSRDAGVAAALQTIVESPNGDARRLLRAVLRSDYDLVQEQGRRLGVDPQVLALVLRLALRPTLLAAARWAAEQVPLGDWTFGHCPVCGSAPGLAEISGEGGARTLHCSVCETAWPYNRLRCPFCESDDFKQLTYLKPEQEQWSQVEVCGLCGQYLKTLDLRELAGPIIVPLDDVATWHLDIIAQKHLSA